MNTQRIGRTRRAKLIRRAIAAGYTRYNLINLSEEQEEQHDNNGGLTIGRHGIHLLGQTDTKCTWGYQHRSGAWLVGVANLSTDTLLPALREAFGDEQIDDSYCGTHGFRLS
jgi:hypothetical protein